jgi:hypothetical protein
MMKIDDNLETTDDGRVVCSHCGAELGKSVHEPLSTALRHESASTNAGPGIKADPALFTDRPIVLRQQFCPGCLVLLSTEVTPGDEPEYRKWTFA